MDIISTLNTLFGSSWTSGINLYMTVAGLGIMSRMHMVHLPGDLTVIANPFIIFVAGALYAIEFVADKIPFVDNIWDSVHTFIRPVGSAALSYMAMAHTPPALQYSVALTSGAVAMSSHLTKATTRVAINSTPVPFANSAASVTEDGLVLGVLYLIAKHPIISSIVVMIFILVSLWILKKLFRFIGKVFHFFFGAKQLPSEH